MFLRSWLYFFIFFNDTPTTEIYTLSLHDALPISALLRDLHPDDRLEPECDPVGDRLLRSEEHTSELQSRSELVCRHLLEIKKPDRHFDRYCCTAGLVGGRPLDRPLR